MRQQTGLRSILRQLRWFAEARTSTTAVAHTIVTRGLALVLNIGTGVICARFLGTEGRGEQAAMGLWPGLLGGLLTLGIPTALRYYLPKRENEASSFLSTALIYGVLLGSLGIIVSALGLPIWLSRYSHEVVLDAQLLMLSAPAFMVTYMMQGFLESRGEFGKANLMFSLPAIFTLLYLIVLVLLHEVSPLGCSLAYMLPPLAITAWRLVEFRRYIRFPFSEFKFASFQLFSYGLRVWGIDVIGTLAAQVDQALVVRFLTGSGLGLYTVALAASRTLTVFQGSIVVVLFPKAASLDSDGAVRLVERAARLSLVAIGSIAVVAGLAVPVVLPLLYGQRFADAAPVAQVLLAEAALSGTTLVLCQAFLSTGRPFVVTLLQGLGLLAVIPLMIVMIPRFGLIGAAGALLLSTTLRLAMVLACYPFLLRRPIPILVPTPDDFRYLIERLRNPGRKD